jgi:Protein of unknown function (DUF2778)
MTSNRLIRFRRGGLFSRLLSQTIPGASALTFSAAFGVWILYGHSPAGRNAPDAPAIAYAPNPYSALFDPGIVSGSTPGSLAQNSPLNSNFTLLDPEPSAAIAELENEAPMSAPSVAIAELESDAPVLPPAAPRLRESVPVPVPRPAELGPLTGPSRFPASGHRFAQQERTPIVPAAPQDNRSFFEKLFGAPQTSKHVLAYAAPEDSIFENAKGIFGSAKGIASSPSSRYDQWTAVYDVAAHTVYMPNGARLEAHSGLGSRLDDPRYASERMRGATPPSVYELHPREQPFHGVRALRLTPIGNGSVYGRTGLLAHTYMLGPHGDSNGCVSFKNYSAFLQAYQNGEIKRLAVVSRLN